MFEDYKGRRVLLTGHTGFKGAWLSQWLTMIGAEVAGIALPPDTEPSLFALLGGAGAASHFFDIADLNRLKKVMGDFQPEIVFHLAAQSLVRRSYAMPMETLLANVIGTAHVLEAARATPSLKAVLVVTSDKVYRNTESGHAFVEDDALGGDDPYSASKAAAEIVTQSWRQSFFRSPSAPLIASARAGNVFGGGDWCQDRLLPDIARAIAAGTPVILRNPASVRPWQFVLEALGGYLMLGERLLRGEADFAQGWNFGPTEAGGMTVGDFAGLALARWGEGRIEYQPDPAAPKEAAMLRLDSAKSRERLGWRPVLSLEEAISLSVSWYRDVGADPGCAARVTAGQIENFARRLANAGLAA